MNFNFCDFYILIECSLPYFSCAMWWISETWGGVPKAKRWTRKILWNCNNHGKWRDVSAAARFWKFPQQRLCQVSTLHSDLSLWCRQYFLWWTVVWLVDVCFYLHHLCLSFFVPSQVTESKATTLCSVSSATLADWEAFKHSLIWKGCYFEYCVNIFVVVFMHILLYQR